jgi:hypothetical protein
MSGSDERAATKPVRMIRLDEGHWLVPGSPYEVVQDAKDGVWRIYHHNTRLAWRFTRYEDARRRAVTLAAGS